MIELNNTFWVQLVNFFVILFVLNYLLIKPIRETIKKRRGHLGDMLEKAEKFNTEAETKLKNYEEQLADARQAAAKDREALREEGLAEEKRIIETASSESKETISKTRAEIESESKSAMENLKSQVDSYAQKVADKVLG